MASILVFGWAIMLCYTHTSSPSVNESVTAELERGLVVLERLLKAELLRQTEWQTNKQTEREREANVCRKCVAFSHRDSTEKDRVREETETFPHSRTAFTNRITINNESKHPRLAYHYFLATAFPMEARKGNMASIQVFGRAIMFCHTHTSSPLASIQSTGWPPWTTPAWKTMCNNYWGHGCWNKKEGVLFETDVHYFQTCYWYYWFIRVSIDVSLRKTQLM